MAKAKRSGAFIAIEGLDGAGKSSNLRNLENWLSHTDTKHFVADEYKDLVFSNTLRTMLNEQNPRVDPVTETFMFYSARIEHTQRILAPYLDSGYHVLTDRYSDSTRAYQSVKLGLERVEAIHAQAAHSLREPDLVLFYDIPVEVYKQRVILRGKGLDAIESRGIEFFTQVRANYLQLAESNPRFVVVDASQPLDAVLAESLRQVDLFLGKFNENHVQP